MNSEKVKLDLEKIIFIGRTYEEYLSMFALSENALKNKRILDCPAGACSFTAVGRQRGLDISAADITYSHSADQLKNKGMKDLNHAMENIDKARENYVWTYFSGVENLREHRMRALEETVKDMNRAKENYIPVTLPELPFKDQEFDIVLSAHFLFMYADRMSEEFHLATIEEMIRVSKEEVRIFPTVDLEGKRYENMDRLIAYLTEGGYMTREEDVPYEFQSSANRMLIIKKTV
ncbi:SAM-dependent methyltransferase [Halobacillus andaensis]|uniref:SAM-dependent methyltransferase n=1 Tax=Halobacillus andaensis TaxID=1176239 RepID=UPI003D73CFAF